MKLRGLSLDLRLGLRMLVKYPGLTIVGGAALAFGIAAGAGGFEIRTQMIEPRLPLDDGRRVVGMRLWDPLSSGPAPVHADAFALWRDRLQTVDDVSAVRLCEHNLTVDGQGEPVAVATNWRTIRRRRRTDTTCGLRPSTPTSSVRSVLRSSPAVASR